MFRIAIFLVILFALAIGFAWLADNPGSVSIQWDWLSKTQVYQVTLLHALVALAAIVAVVMMVWWVISGVLHSPEAFGRWRAGRRRDKGYNALSRGLVAAGAGNAPLARRLAAESDKLLEHEPLVKLLDAQTALLEGNSEDARGKFEAMTADPDTQLLGLRGLYVEAEKEGNGEASAHFAKEAYAIAPETPWAAQGLIKSQAVVGDWEDALKTLENNRATGLYDREEYKRKRAVILTALALQLEDSEPDRARTLALKAAKLAPPLVPAATLAARLCVRLGDPRKAGKALEASWKIEPHPDVAEAYVTLDAGDVAQDRLKRAEKLAGKKSGHPEGNIAIALAAIAAGDFERARSTMDEVLKSAPTERACLIMADIEEAENGDQGRMREWLARAVTAPRDAAWTADGFVADEWAPFSPVTGELDAFKWRVPLEQIGGAAQAVDYSQLPAQPTKGTGDLRDEEPTVIELAVAAGAASAAASASPAKADDANNVETHEVKVVEAEIVELEESDGTKVEPDKSSTEVSPAPGSETVDNSSSPFRQANLDADNDGVIDHRPDDPGLPKKKKRKNFFF